MQGRFVTFEGGEGVGKTQLIHRLEQYLTSCGTKVVLTREPGGTPQADRIRSLFAIDDHEDPWLPLSEALLIAAARCQHVYYRITPSLQSGFWVLCDRFADSTRVYQSAVKSQDLEFLISAATQGLEPDLTFLLDCPADISLARLKHRNALVSQNDTQETIRRFDQQILEVQHKRRMAFLELAARFPKRMVVIDSSQPPELVLNQAITAIKDRGLMPTPPVAGKLE